ncbi:MAG: hypothetical protein RIB60_07325 [Phycisphaerales bacterium]
MTPRLDQSFHKVCLFGGALFAAGLSAPPADAAPEIVFGPYAQGRVLTDPDGTGLDELKRSTLGPGPFLPGVFDAYSTTASFGAGVGEVWFTHDRAGATLSYSAAVFDVYFTVTEPGTLEVDWDAGGWFDIALMTEDGNVVFSLDFSGAGSQAVPVTPGTQYRVVLGTYGWDPGGDSWGRMRLVGESSGTGCNAADINGDGILNFDDIDAFVAGFLGGCP